MSLFLLLAASLLLAAYLFFIPVLRGARPRRVQRHTPLNLLVYRQRRGELERELADGALEPATFEKLCEELERDLLDDTAAPQAAAKHEMRGRKTVLIALALLPFLGAGLYWALGRPELIDAPPAGAGGMNAGVFRDSIAKLTGRLRQNPDDMQGWLLLGRSHQALGESAEALAAYEQAQALQPGDPDIQALRAESLARMQGDSLRGRPTELIEGILITHPDHPTGLWLAGLAAAERGDKTTAIRRWRLLREQLPPDDEEARQLDDYIAQLSGEAPSVQATGAASVRVRVELAPELAGKIHPEDTLFVFARATQGPAMPLAIVRRQARDLPLELTLDDSMAMTPEGKLSAHPSIRLGARLSRSGNAIPAPGDLQGQLGPVETNGNSVYRVVIDQSVE
jgi:cytochrome c-type biogenesis protein CcmH